MGELIRTFIAVDFDNPEIVSRAQEVQRRLMESGAVMKPVEPQNLHTTLWFFGERFNWSWITRGRSPSRRLR